MSQYPHEEEVLFAPLTGIDVQSLRVENEVLVVDIRISINQQHYTIERVSGDVVILSVLCEPINTPLRAHQHFTSMTEALCSRVR